MTENLSEGGYRLILQYRLRPSVSVLVRVTNKCYEMVVGMTVE